jgi:hypothetical protein
MTELLAALLGAIVGGALSAWVGAKQTTKVLKHETDLAAAERREAQRVDEDRRHALAADQLITALAEYVTRDRDDPDYWALYARVEATASAHEARRLNAAAFLQAGASYAHSLPDEVRRRWEALTWLVRFNQVKQANRTGTMRIRDVSDMLNFAEYVRQSLSAVSEGSSMPRRYPAPEPRREELRVWGFKPEGADEPDLTNWHQRDRLVGPVRLTTGPLVWYGPNGVEEVMEEPDDPASS